MGSYRHLSLNFFYRNAYFQGEVGWYFSTINKKNKSVSFLMKLVEIPYNVSLLLSSFIFSVLTSKWNFSKKSLKKNLISIIECKIGIKKFHIKSQNLFISELLKIHFTDEQCFYVSNAEGCLQDLHTLFLKRFHLYIY